MLTRNKSPGKWTPRVEDERVLTGTGRYIDDVKLPHMLRVTGRIAWREPVFIDDFRHVAAHVSGRKPADE